MSEHINMNDGWKYSNSFTDEMIGVNYDDSSMETVRLPHTNTELPFHYFDEQICQQVSCYRRQINVKKEWAGKQVLITFEAVGHEAIVYCNGKIVTKHSGGYTAFTAELSPYLDFEGNMNILAVAADSRESLNIPPFGNVIDYLTYGGIYREVSMEIKEQEAIEDAFIITKEAAMETGSTFAEPSVGAGYQENLQKAEVHITFHGINPGSDLSLHLSVIDQNDKPVYSELIPVSEPVMNHTFRIGGVVLWDIDHPILYNLKLILAEDSNHRILDEKTVRFGFRSCEFREDGFYLNKKKIRLVGLNRHQSFPYVGYAMPKRIQRLDAELLKNELQVNAVRTSHYPQSRHFLDRCDELGLLVFTEIPGWQHIGDEEWKAAACENVKEMVLQYRNHPSIILWGVRINESQDDDEFYTKTNQIAHTLDPSRQTGGVRYLKKSHLLEDVYTYNDFLYNGRTKGLDLREKVTSKTEAPYMVTEYNGHMFPTKAYDNEEHRLQHALRHARVLDSFFEQEKIAGAFGWCMTDYNTHKDFGSGDRICYHGVMDMFRNPKLAAAVYASQSNRETVFELSSTMDIGDHPAGNIGEVYAFTNADCIRLYKNGTYVKEFYPDKKKFPNLPHPPVLIGDFIGELLEKQEHFSHRSAEAMKEVLSAVKEYGPNQLPLKYKLKMAFLLVKEHLTMEDGVRLYYRYVSGWGGSSTAFRFEAVKNQKVVKTILKKPANQPSLKVTASAVNLTEEETYDAAQVRILATDESGNRLPYYQEPVTLEAWGAVELIGPKVISLKGGAAGAYIKTKGCKGKGGLRIIQEQLGVAEVSFTVS